MIASLIVDCCSIAMSWCFADEATIETQAILDRIVYESVVVPAHWHLEVINVLALAERRQRTTTAASEEFLALLGRLEIEVDDQTTDRAFYHILPLCRSVNLTSYDAAYLELALRRELPLATLDRQLGIAARKLGVSVLVLPT